MPSRTYTLSVCGQNGTKKQRLAVTTDHYQVSVCSPTKFLGTQVYVFEFRVDRIVNIIDGAWDYFNLIGDEALVKIRI